MPGSRVPWIDQFPITEEDIKGCVARGEHFKVSTFANKPIAPSFIVDGWDKCGLCRNGDPKFHAENIARIDPLIKMGLIPMFSCDYYLVSSYLLTVGQHCSWGESSAIPWCNAILGARTNIDGSFQSAYLGKVPAYDMHLDENRIATLEIH